MITALAQIAIASEAAALPPAWLNEQAARREPDSFDYTLLEQSDAPGTSYMREVFTGRAVLDELFKMPFFQAFAARLDELLARSLQPVFLSEVL